MSRDNLKQDTLCVHAGSLFDSATGGVNSPVYTSSAFQFLDRPETIYPRYFNTPNQRAVVEKLCALEGGEAGMVLSSGMAAISTVFMTLLQPGDHVVVQDRIYGGTHYLVRSQLEQLGVSFTLVTGDRVADYEQAILPNSRILYFETPANPLLGILDIKGLSKLAKTHGITTVIDNTFASPINQNPIALGVDVVIHSGTKYLGGHSDLCFGAVVTSRKIREAMQATAINLGGSLDAFTCYQIERSLKTLSLRVGRQNENAFMIAKSLEQHPAVQTVYYPGLESHQDHIVARAQMKGYGGMLSFCLKSSQLTARAYCKKLKLIKTAVSLGGIETTITIPAVTSHSKLSTNDRIAAGVTDDLLRLSVGIEDCEDLLNDLQQAFD